MRSLQILLPVDYPLFRRLWRASLGSLDAGGAWRASNAATLNCDLPLRLRSARLSSRGFPSFVGARLYCRTMAKHGSDRARLVKEVTNYRTTLIASGVAAVGLALLWAVTFYGSFDAHSTTKAVLEQLGGLLITTGGLAVLWDLRGRRDMIREVLAKVELSADLEATGLRRASMDWRVVPWGELIAGSRQIDVFIAYGSTWLSTHSVELAEFAKSRRNKMRYFLPDPEDPIAMSVLAERFDYTQEIIKSKVEEAARTVAKLSKDGSADIRVWYRRGAPTFTCYRFDEQIVVTMYQHKVGRGAIPSLVMQKGTFGGFFTGDLAAIEEQSREVAINDLLGVKSGN
jgi:hypothetical protein